MTQVVLEKIYKSFPSGVKNQPHVILRQINLTVESGEFLVIVGPSGCGKSTLLRLIAGLETLTAGQILIDDQPVNNLAPKARDVAMVFQNYALYPHLTVYDNLAFGLRRTEPATKTSLEQILRLLSRPLPKNLRYLSKQEKSIAQRVLKVAELLQIQTLLNRYPKQLSGGQKQRVALGRAIARNPRVFLMDEPLSNLDAKLRSQTRTQIVQLQQQLGITTLYVTHDQTEAMTMGTRIAVMNQGQILQVAKPLELYHHPANRFVAEFIGSPPMNFLKVHYSHPLKIHHPAFQFNLPPVWEKFLKNYHQQPLTLGVRPEHLKLDDSESQQLPVKINRIERLGYETLLFVQAISEKEEELEALQVRINNSVDFQSGDVIHLAIAMDKIHFFDPQTQDSLSFLN